MIVVRAFLGDNGSVVRVVGTLSGHFEYILRVFCDKVVKALWGNLGAL